MNAAHPDRPSFAKQAAVLLVSLGVCFAAACIGGLATAASIREWYPQLTKPSWTPPDGLFGPVWTALYAMMGLAAWQLWRNVGFPAARGPLTWFGTQLTLNVGWSVLFFGLRSPGAALVEIIVLWATIAGTIRAFWSGSRAAAALLAPYLAWVSFAALLNATIWWMNR